MALGSAKNENEETEMRAKKVKPSECVSMPELSRDFYPSSNRFYLKNTISEDGFSMAHPLRAIFNKKLKKYEIFAGNHRLEIAKDLQLPWVPIVVEDIPRHEALAQGFKDNKTHASYNVIDQANHLKSLILELHPELKTAKKFPGLDSPGGRGRKSPLHEVSKATGMGIKTIRNYLSLLMFPQSIQKSIGEGKLRYSVALEFLKLNGTKSEHLISRLAEKAVENEWSREETRRRVNGILKGVHHLFKACDNCGRGFPKDKLTWMGFCPQCIEKLRNQDLETRKPGNSFQVSDSETPFMDSVKRLEEINEVRRKIGRKPLKELRT